jgi:uncharacterized repeat protein (TIGR03943 family)
MFIRDTLWPLIAGGLGLGLVLFSAVYFRFGRPAAHPATGWTRCGQAAIVLLPLVYMAFGGQAGGLGADAFEKRAVGGGGYGPTGPRGLGKPAYKTDGTLNEITLIDLLFDVEQLAGLPVALEGRVFHDESQPDDAVILYRFVITCCAADALPAGAVVKHAEAREWPEDTWVRVEGLADLEMIEGEPAPVVRAERISAIEAPKNPYLSP